MRTRKSDKRGARGRIRRPAARIALSAVLLLLTSLFSFGQSGLPRRVGGFSFGGLFPMGGFNERVEQNGLGLGLYYGWRARNAPVFYGLELSFDAYGHAVRNGSAYGLEFDVETFNSIGQGLAFVRIQPRTGAVVTYLEALAGVSYLFTETSLVGADDTWDESLDSETNFDDVTVTAGVGAGVSVRLSRGAGGFGRGTFLDFKVRYMAGGRAEYLKQGSSYPGEFDDSVLPERSATSFVTAQLGLSWFF